MLAVPFADEPSKISSKHTAALRAAADAVVGLGRWRGVCEITQVSVSIHHLGDSKTITHHHPDPHFHGQQMTPA